MSDQPPKSAKPRLSYEERLDRALERPLVGDPNAEEQRNAAIAVAVQQRDCRCATCQFLRALDGQLGPAPPSPDLPPCLPDLNEDDR